MLGQRRRRWPNIKTASDQCLVWVVSCNQFSGYIKAVNLYSIGYCWPTLDRPRHARFEAEWFFKVNCDRYSAILNLNELKFFKPYLFLKPHILFYGNGLAIWHGGRGGGGGKGSG